MKLFKVVSDHSAYVSSSEVEVVVGETKEEVEECMYQEARERADSEADYDDEDFDEESMYEGCYAIATEITSLAEFHNAQAYICGAPTVVSLLESAIRDGASAEWLAPALVEETKALKEFKRARIDYQISREVAAIAEAEKRIKQLLEEKATWA